MTSNSTYSYQWRHIEPLTDDERSINLRTTKPLYETWRTARSRLEQSSPNNLRIFNEKLIRRLSIETGIIERIYDLDAGTTEALVTHGFIENLVPHSSTNIAPARLIDILNDQEAAVKLMLDCVAGEQPLSIWTIHQLHETLTANQDTTTAIDQFGNRFEIPLLKGRFKENPNNPRRPDGTIHGYCPPLHVASEMDNLLDWFAEYTDDDPIITATWLHHRFTQIHPYQDGNGRVARALCAFALLQAGLLPIIVNRDIRADYIKALEIADDGDLSNLAALFAGLERRAILQAISIDADYEVSSQQTLSSVALGNLARRIEQRGSEPSQISQSQLDKLRTVNDVAKTLRQHAHQTINAEFDTLNELLSSIAATTLRIDDGGADYGTAHWYKNEVVQAAVANDIFANFTDDHYFVKGSIRANDERLIFVASFHHVGREIYGIMEATAFCRIESFEHSDDREISAQGFIPCSTEPFVFTYKTESDDIAEEFGMWLDSAVAIAIQTYSARL